VTSAAMVAAFYGIKTDPEQLNASLEPGANHCVLFSQDLTKVLERFVSNLYAKDFLSHDHHEMVSAMRRWEQHNDGCVSVPPGLSPTPPDGPRESACATNHSAGSHNSAAESRGRLGVLSS
jgi:hypothetical protein